MAAVRALRAAMLFPSKVKKAGARACACAANTLLKTALAVPGLRIACTGTEPDCMLAGACALICPAEVKVIGTRIPPTSTATQLSHGGNAEFTKSAAPAM